MPEGMGSWRDAWFIPLCSAAACTSVVSKRVLAGRRLII